MIFLKIYDILSRHKVASALLLVLSIGVCVWLSLSLKYKEDITEFLPQNADNERYTAVYEGLGDQGSITIIFRPADSIADREAIMNAVDAFEQCWDSLAEADTLRLTMQCRVEQSQAFDAIDYIRDNIALFLTPDDYRRADSLLAQPGYADTCMHNVHHMLSFPLSAIATEAITHDPLNLFSPALQRLASLSASDKYTMEDDYLFDSDGNAYAFLNSPYSSSDTRTNSHLAELLQQALNSTMAQEPAVKATAVGAALIAATNANQIKRDSFLAIALAAIFIMAILFFAMGHKRNILWLGFTVVAGWLFALAVIALFKPAISIIVIGIGSVLVGIAVNYPLHFLDHIREHTDRREALKDMVEPLVTGNITTVSAFACLVFVKAEAMRDLGLFGALMLVGTILFTMIFLPLFAKPGRHRKHQAVSETCSEEVGTVRKSRRIFNKILLPLVILLTFVLGYFSQNTSFDSDLHNINYMTAQQREDLQLLSSSLQEDTSLSILYLVSESTTLDEALMLQEQFLANGHAENASGVCTLLPSIQRQQQSLDEWQRFNRRHADLPQIIRTAARREGLVTEAFDPFILQLESDYAPIAADQMEPLQQLCSNYLLTTDSCKQVVSLLRIPNNQAAATKTQLRQQSADNRSFVFDISDVGSNLISALSDDFNYILYVCSFVVFFFLWLSLGRIELALLAFLPLTVGWIWILGLMDLAAVKFNIVNIILATFIFGQGDDYTIFITEGLMYEHAYGQRRLRSYQRSVIVSALLMFVGIGVLIFAKHPAMRSLAEVAIIGMASVILMAYYLPPLIYRWLTTRHGQTRLVPITLQRLLRTFFSLLVFVVFALFLVTPFTFLYRLIGRDSERKRLWFHNLICRCCRAAMKSLPGVKHRIINEYGETFDHPAVIICNHQSHLDLIATLLLTPKLVIMTNDWVWRNPIYGAIIRYAEFYPASNGYDANLPKLRSLVDRGYSILIFPEGTRTIDGSIGRFHKGAFQLAQQLDIDILPLFLHGADHVMPKTDIILRPGIITMEIGQRIAAADLEDKDILSLTQEIRHYYQEHYAQLRLRLEDEAYCLPLVRYQYMYKGRTIERRCRRALADWQQGRHDGQPGQGEVALLIALAHRDKEYTIVFNDADDYRVAQNCAAIPANLHYQLKGGVQ